MPAAAPTFQRRPYQYAEMSPEMQLLCLSATTSLPAKNKEQIAHLLAGARLDWAEVVRQAEWHGTAALLATNICEQGFDVPPDAVKQLKEICRATAQQGLLLSWELLRVLQALKTAGVSAVPYKGPALAQAVYGNPALRRPGDLDLLLSHESLAPAKKVLRELGYAPCLDLSPQTESRWVRAYGALDFVNPENGIALDLHCGMAPRHMAIAMPLEALLDRAGEISFAGSLVPVLQPEDLVAVLCVHGTKHGWERLGWICDLAQTLHTYPQLDWALVFKRAGVARIIRQVLLGAWLAKTLLQTELPSEVEARCSSDRTLAGLAAQVGRWLESSGAGAISNTQRWLFLLKTRERYRDRALAFARYVFTPDLQELKPFSTSVALTPVAYAMRPLRVASRIVSRQAAPTRRRANIQTV